jgi:prolyl-tRNA synthetase
MASLKESKVRAQIDSRRDKTPAWKYFHHEQRGVPIRVEVGEKDLDKGVVTMARRDTGVKSTAPLGEVVQSVLELLETIQGKMRKFIYQFRKYLPYMYVCMYVCV